VPGCSDKNKHFIRLVPLKMLYGQTLKCMQILCMESWSCSIESNSGCIFKSQRCSLINMESLRITFKGLKFMQYQDYPLEGNFLETLDFARLPSMLLAFLLAMNNFTEILFSLEKQKPFLFGCRVTNNYVTSIYLITVSHPAVSASTNTGTVSLNMYKLSDV